VKVIREKRGKGIKYEREKRTVDGCDGNILIY
jgi:hypothetical protein